ncbi:hypothetical protein HOD96_04240 [Candidatus Falkowbacteria bacterium]|jgi:hypothetical protein|nr:hypothetical protein [Candidatus Falkowbacteria bacterium]MBT4433158.1 hypothetical protein [Candidatus Falkowbacteria bacterium]
MPKLQEIFTRIQKTKKEQRKIRVLYKEALQNSHEYYELTEKLKELKEKKKQIEENVKADFNTEFSRLEDLKLEAETDKEILSDLALNQLIKGEKVEVIDQEENQYEPLFSVRFKKAQ